MTREEIIAALKVIGPFEIVQGDAIQRNNPHTRQFVNSNIAWVVGNGNKAAHRLRTEIEKLNKLLEETP